MKMSNNVLYECMKYYLEVCKKSRFFSHSSDEDILGLYDRSAAIPKCHYFKINFSYILYI